MSRRIILVGGFPADPSTDFLLARLKADVSGDVDWFWLNCEARSAFQPERKKLNRIIDELRKWNSDQKKDASQRVEGRVSQLDVVLLPCVNGSAKSELFQAWPDPILAPKDLATADELVEWISSQSSGLFPRTEWVAGVLEAALVAILCKLLRNKSWNASVSGHQWTREADLVGQAPVFRKDHQPIAIAAREMLPNLADKLLITKGAEQGKTPKEWSIDTQFLPAVKAAIAGKSLTPLRQVLGLASLLDKIDADEDHLYRLDGEVVSERIMYICRER